MPRYEIVIKRYHLEDSWDEPMHDVEAESPEAALLRFFEVVAGAGPTDELPLEEAVNALGERVETGGDLTAQDCVELVLQGGYVSLWEGESDIYAVHGVHEETTELCPACQGHGRVELVRGLSHVLQRAKAQVEWWDVEENGQGPELEHLRERSTTLIDVLRDLVAAVETEAVVTSPDQ
jgi:hypothetical protein